MDVKEAVRAAKKYVEEIFSDERITNIGLEEVEFLDPQGEWQVTIGFSRPWDQPSTLAGLNLTQPNRSYKIIRISDKGGNIISVKNREMAA